MHFVAEQNTALLSFGHHENEATLFRHYREVKLPDGRTVSEKLAAEF